MSWLHEHAPEFGALGSIFMNLATIVIIYFNVHQLKLNSHSLNVDINFKVFELRKNVYMQILTFIKGLSSEKGLRQHLIELENGELVPTEQINELIELIENYKYLFAPTFAIDLDIFVLHIKQGLQLESDITQFKNKDASTWTAEDQNDMHALGHRLKDITSRVTAFNLDQFLPYLNVSNFHRDLMRDDTAAPNLSAFSNTIMLVKKGAALVPKLIKAKNN